MSGEQAPTRTTGERLIVGRVTGAYGVKGWIKVFSWTDPREGIARYNPWFLGREGRGDWRQVTLESARRHGKTVIAKLDGVDDRDAAQALTGRDIAIDETQLEALGEDEFYWRELIGLRVSNRQGSSLGTVSKLMETGAHDVLVITDAAGRDHLVPYVPGHSVLEIDLPAGSMIVDWELDWLDDAADDQAGDRTPDDSGEAR